VKTILAAIVIAAIVAAPSGDPLTRFSYSADLAQRMNQRYAGTATFLTDDNRGRKLTAPVLLGAIQGFIRVFPACGNRQIEFAYAYGEDDSAHLVAFSQTGERAANCPATAVVALSPASGAVTVRSFPEA